LGSGSAGCDIEVKDRVPRVDTVEKLASVLHVSPGFLAFGVEHPFELAAESVSAGLPMRLAQLRQERGFSYRELARLSQTSHKFIQMTETGATVPSIAKVEQLAQALAVSPSWLAFGIGERDFAPPRRSRAAAATVQPASPLSVRLQRPASVSLKQGGAYACRQSETMCKVAAERAV
jgi:transcriptional regulator with XRE-family HTH domain